MDCKNEYQAEIFYSRINKNYRMLRRWARKERITCYRIYDKDIPEIPLAVDMYEFLPEHIESIIECAKFISEQNKRFSENDPLVKSQAALRRYLVIYLYERPYYKSRIEEDLWLSKMAESASRVFNVSQERIIIKERKKQKGNNQYIKIQHSEKEKLIECLIQEQGQIFKINLSSYIDTGLFFDHRPLRSIIRKTSKGKTVLNLFCYTGSFSVYAAEGKAAAVESVDLSNTYLSWAKENMKLNGFTDKKYTFVRSDVFKFIEEKKQFSEKKSYDLIIIDPPTFSNSKSLKDFFDINKSWHKLINDCLTILNQEGRIYFSTNSRHLIFDESKMICPKGMNILINDITSATIPKDFKNYKIHRCWEIILK